MGDRWKMTAPHAGTVKKNSGNECQRSGKKVAAGGGFVFSAVDMTKEEIKKIEEEYAKTETPVVSNNSAHRWTPDVPMVVPESIRSTCRLLNSRKSVSEPQEALWLLSPTVPFKATRPCSPHGRNSSLWRWLQPHIRQFRSGQNFQDWPEMVGNIIPYIGGEEEKE